MEYFLTFLAFFYVGKMLADVHSNAQAEEHRRRMARRFEK